MLKSMIGMIASSRTTAMALARPKLPKVNISLYIRFAIDLGVVLPLVMV